jgi:hypothetical protein
MVRRTAVTALVVAILLGGCAGVGGPPATDAPATATTGDVESEGPGEATTDRTTRTSDGYYRGYEFSARETTESGLARDLALPRSRLERRTVWGTDSFAERLFERGAAEQVDVARPNATSVGSLDDAVLRANGTYYAVERSIVARHAGTAYGMTLEGPLRTSHHDDYDRAAREAVNASSLSAADRALFEYAVPPTDERESAVHSAGYDYVFGESVDPSNATLVDGDRHYVRHEGDLFRVASDGPVGNMVHYRVRYELRVVADSAAAFVDGRVSDHVTPLNGSNATGATREVLVAAVEGDTVEWAGRSRAPERIRGAAAWVREHPPAGRDAYVRYGGRLYRVRVQHVVE